MLIFFSAIGAVSSQLSRNGVVLEPVYSPRFGLFAKSSVIASGEKNSIVQPPSSVDRGTLADHSVILGGISNRVTGSYATIMGGFSNSVSSNFGAILGGNSNKVSGRFGVVLGGSRNWVDGRFSLAGGYRATASHERSAVLSFKPNTECKAGGPNEVRICATKLVLDAPEIEGLAGARRRRAAEESALNKELRYWLDRVAQLEERLSKTNFARTVDNTFAAIVNPEFATYEMNTNETQFSSSVYQALSNRFGGGETMECIDNPPMEGFLCGKPTPCSGEGYTQVDGKCVCSDGYDGEVTFVDRVATGCYKYIESFGIVSPAIAPKETTYTPYRGSYPSGSMSLQYIRATSSGQSGRPGGCQYTDLMLEGDFQIVFKLNDGTTTTKRKSDHGYIFFGFYEEDYTDFNHKTLNGGYGADAYWGVYSVPNSRYDVSFDGVGSKEGKTYIPRGPSKPNAYIAFKRVNGMLHMFDSPTEPGTASLSEGPMTYRYTFTKKNSEPLRLAFFLHDKTDWVEIYPQASFGKIKQTFESKADCPENFGGPDCKTDLRPPTSCLDQLNKFPSSKTGAYTFTAPSGKKVNVWCDMTINGGGWTRVLQLNSDRKNCKKSFRDVPLSDEIVGDYCSNKEFTFSRSMMLASNHELLFTDAYNRMMWYKFDNCVSKTCTCDQVTGEKRALCFFLSVTADYSGGAPLMGGDNYDIFVDAYDWKAKKWRSGGDGHCGGTNANGHSQFNCEPHPEDGKGNCGQRWHYGTRHDGSKKGGSNCGGGTNDAGCAWNWYTGLATRWRDGCNNNNAAWMMKGSVADGAKNKAEVWYR